MECEVDGMVSGFRAFFTRSALNGMKWDGWSAGWVHVYMET